MSRFPSSNWLGYHPFTMKMRVRVSQGAVSGGYSLIG